MAIAATARAAWQPALAVVLPTHHRQKLLAEAHDSAARQTVEAWEIVVPNDGSRKPIDVGPGDEHGRLYILFNDRPLGCAASKATRPARGDGGGRAP